MDKKAQLTEKFLRALNVGEQHGLILDVKEAGIAEVFFYLGIAATIDLNLQPQIEMHKAADKRVKEVSKTLHALIIS